MVMTFTVRHGFSMALIEIDGKHRSFYSMVDLSMANCECHNQMVYPTISNQYHPPDHFLNGPS